MYSSLLLEIRSFPKASLHQRLMLLVSGILFVTAIVQAQHIGFEGDNARAHYKVDSLRRESIKLSLLSFLRDLPQDSIKPYTKGGFIQVITTLEIGKTPLSDQSLMIIETGSDYIRKTFKEQFLSQPTNNIFMSNTSDKKIIGPYIGTFLMDENGSISKATKEQLEYVPGLISHADLVTAPVFPNCESVEKEDLKLCFKKQMNTHIASNFKYPQEALSNGYEGNAVVIFTIESDGTLRNVYSRSENPQFGKEAERIIRLLPKFKPGIYKGYKVDTSFQIPIRFRLQ